MKKILLLIVLSLGCFLSASVFDWQYIENQRFIVFYPEGYKFQAEEVMKYSAYHYDEIRSITGNDKEFKTRIIIQDPGNVPNGYADFVNMKIGIFTQDPTSLESFANDNWFRIVGVHELVHISQLSNHSSYGSVLPFLAGNMFSPNAAIPMWIVEGITVFKESTITPYEGRMNYGYYEALVSARASEGKLPNVFQANYWDPTDLHGQYYTYGGAFFKFLSETYGDDKIGELFRINGKKWWGLTSNIFPMLALDGSSSKVFGKNFPELFEEWHAYEIVKARNWKISGELLKFDQENTYEISRIQRYNDKVIFCRSKLDFNNYYHEIVSYDVNSNKEEILKTFPGSLSGNLEIRNDKLYYGLAEVKGGFANLDQMGKGVIGVIYEIDLKTNKSKKILKANFTDFTILEDGSILYAQSRTDSFGSKIMKYDGKISKLAVLDRKVSEIIANSKNIYTVDKEMVGSWDVSILDIENRRFTPLLNSPWQETRIKLDNETLYYTANYDSKYNSYQLDLVTNEKSSLTNSSFAVDGVVFEDCVFFNGLTATSERLYKSDLDLEVYTKMLPVADYPREPKAVVEKHGNAFLKNLKYLFFPSSRFNMSNVSGSDGIGYNDYNVNITTLDDEIDLGFEWTTRVFNPISLSFSAQELRTNKEYLISGTLPLYQSMRTGLQRIDLQYVSNFHDEVFPGVGVNAGTAKLESYLNGYYDVNSDGYLGKGALRKYFSQFNISLSGNYYDGVDATPFLAGSDYDEIINANGFEVELRTSFELYRIRNGLWNPNIGIGDIDASLFTQYSKLDKEIIGYGAELNVDLGALWLFQSKFNIGANYIEGEIKPIINFGLDF